MNEPDLQKSDRFWEVLCHLSALVMFVGIPLGNIVGPLVVWLLRRGDSPSVDEHGKESLNFQISLTVYLFAFGVITAGLVFLIVGLLLIPILVLLLIVGPLLDLVFVIVAAIKASNGEFYRYPGTIRFIP